MSYPYPTNAPGPYPNGSLTGAIVIGIHNAYPPISYSSNSNNGFLYYSYEGGELYICSNLTIESKQIACPAPTTPSEVISYWEDTSKPFHRANAAIVYNSPVYVYPTSSSPTIGTFTYPNTTPPTSLPIKKSTSSDWGTIYYVHDTTKNMMFMYNSIRTVSFDYLNSRRATDAVVKILWNVSDNLDNTNKDYFTFTPAPADNTPRLSADNTPRPSADNTPRPSADNTPSPVGSRPQPPSQSVAMNTPPSQSDNTVMYAVGGIIGVTAIGGIVYYFMSKSTTAVTSAISKKGGHFNIGD